MLISNAIFRMHTVLDRDAETSTSGVNQMADQAVAATSLAMADKAIVHQQVQVDQTDAFPEQMDQVDLPSNQGQVPPDPATNLKVATAVSRKDDMDHGRFRRER